METISSLGDELHSNKEEISAEFEVKEQDESEPSVFDCFSKIVEGYSKNHGTSINWDTDVNLKPPKAWKNRAPDGDRYLLDYYNSLQYTLYETGYPETVDRTDKPRTVINKERVNAVLLSSPVECVGILLEGGKQVPGGFHLVMSPTWVSKTPLNEDGSLSKLWLHKSISFHENGTTYIDEYIPPRPVTYLVNYFTKNVTSGQRNDGAEIEKGIDCPMSSSTKLCEMVDDKVWTRDIMASVGMETPITLALRKKPKRKLLGAHPDMRYIDFAIFTENDKDLIMEQVMNFCDNLKNRGIEKVVVKPSGPQFLGSIGVSFHDVGDDMEVAEAALALFIDLDDGCSVLVEEFIEPLAPLKTNIEEAPLWVADEDMGFRVRATICRDHDNVPITTLINCNVGNKKHPINGDNSVCQTLYTTLLGYNVQDENVVKELEREIRYQCSKVMSGIIERENRLSPEERGTLGGQTDVIGIDMILTNRKGQLTPVGIEVNGHDCTINTQLFDCMTNLFINASGQSSQYIYKIPQSKYSPSTLTTVRLTQADTDVIEEDPVLEEGPMPDLDLTARKNKARLKEIREREKNLQELRYKSGEAMGRSVRPLIRNIIARSQRYTMQDKKILAVGGGGVSKARLWPDARSYGIKVILVDSDPNHIAKDEVYKMIHCDFDDHNQDFAHARNICNQLQAMGEKVDGCLTFWEDCVPLAAMLGEMLGTKGMSYKAALTGKKKSRTQNALNQRTGDIPHWPRTFLYSSQSHHLSSTDQIEPILEKVNFPALLKLEHGSSAVGVTVVDSAEELTKKFDNIAHQLTSETDFPGIGLGHDNSMVLMDFHGGSEHDIDVVIYDRKLVAAFISDNGPTNLPFFVETAGTMPSTLPDDKQAQLITAAYQCCTEIGLSNGTFNVEMKMTKMGPKLIEINARMGGFYLRDWIKRVYGVDLMYCAMMISAGIKPCVPKILPEGQLMGIMLVPSHHNHICSDEKFFNAMQNLENEGEIVFSQLSNSTEVVLGQFEEPFANITVNGVSVVDAKSKLKHVSEVLKIDNEHYNIDKFLQYF